MKKFIIYLMFAGLFFCNLQVKATKIILKSFEEMVYFADFVGVIECTKAGGIIAEYKVIKALKSDDNKKNIRIRITPNPSSTGCPVVFAGEKYFVILYNNHYLSQPIEKAELFLFPLEIRNLKFDYLPPFLQGIFRLKDDAGAEQYIKRFKKFTSIPKGKRENYLYNIRIKKYGEYSRYYSEKDKQKILKNYNELKNINTVNRKLDKLVEFINFDKENSWLLKRFIYFAGGEKTLQYLENIDVKNSSIKKRELIEDIKLKLKPKNEVYRRKSTQSSIQPSAEQILEFKKELFSEEIGFLPSPEFQILAKPNPEIVVEYLCSLPNLKNDWRYALKAYRFGTSFALMCEKNRKENFIKLLKAKNDYIKTAAAVYICFEDKQLGIEALKKLVKLKNEAGIWAALTLVRRGDSNFVPRLLEAFKITPENNYSLLSHLNIQRRTLILLSNSANFSNVPQPPIERSGLHKNKEYYEKLKKWWNTYKNKIKLIDVWAKELTEQKVD